MKSIEWIDRAKIKLGGISDYALAERIGMTRSAMSKHRTGKVTTLSDETAFHIAEILNINPLKVIADQQAENAKTEQLRTFWKRAAGATATIIFIVGTGAFLPVKSYSYVGIANVVTIHYANS